MNHAHRFALLVIVLAAVGCSSPPRASSKGRDPIVPGSVHSNHLPPTSAAITVRVIGNVEHPGDYALAPGSNLHDLLVRIGNRAGRDELGHPWPTLTLTRPDGKRSAIRFMGDRAADTKTIPLGDGDIVFIPISML
jgi:hypothetical protein